MSAGAAIDLAINPEWRVEAGVAFDAIVSGRGEVPDHVTLVTHAIDAYRDLYAHKLAKSRRTSKPSCYAWEWYRGDQILGKHSEWHAVCLFCRLSLHSAEAGKITAVQRMRVNDHAERCALMWLAGLLVPVFPRAGYRL